MDGMDGWNAGEGGRRGEREIPRPKRENPAELQIELKLKLRFFTITSFAP
jgi:hypothetical protein